MSLVVENVCKDYLQANGDKVKVLDSLSLNVERGQKVAIMGPSGSGKTTLLSLLAGLESPTSGSLVINDNQIELMNERQLTNFRALNLGIVFQRFHLISYLNALENIALPLEILKDKNAIEKAKHALYQVGLEHRSKHLPAQLSGGECQRVAIARAFITTPSLLLADEPSGSLDEQTSSKVMQLLFDLVDQYKTTLVMVTHNSTLAKCCDQLFELGEGKLKQVMTNF